MTRPSGRTPLPRPDFPGEKNYFSEGGPCNPCERNDQLARMEDKLDLLLDRQGGIAGRIFAHELVAVSFVTLAGLGLTMWGILK